MGDIQSLIMRLNARRRVRVWSIIITVFGDIIAGRGGAISAKTIQDLLLAMGIEAGTVRTAFSRLTRDGWVERVKIGRASFYHLSPTGKAPFAAATDRIYAAYPNSENSDTNETWLLLREHEVSTPRLIRGSAESIRLISDDTTFVAKISPDNVPDWIKEKFCLKEHREGLDHLMEDFAPLNAQNLSPLDALVARCLLIHEWRRLVLQFDPVPIPLQPANWPERECHSFVANLFHSLLDQSEDWLNSHGIGPNGPLPQPTEGLMDRFR